MNDQETNYPGDEFDTNDIDNGDVDALTHPQANDDFDSVSDSFGEPDKLELDSSEQDTARPVQQADKRVKSPRKGSGAVAWLALLLGLGSATGAAYTYWEQQEFQSSYLDTVKQEQQKATNATSNSIQNSISAKLNSELSTLKDDNDALVSEITTNNRRLERKLSSNVDELGERLAETESKIITLRGFSDEAKYAYVKAEVEYFLQTANNRLMLAQDVGSALSALQAADERLNILRDPSLVRVRAEVRDEIQALKAVEQPDITGIALSLASIAKQVPDLPMRMHDDEDYFKEEIPLKEGEGWRVGLSNVWRNMRGTLDRLVEVRDATPSDAPMLSVEDEALLYSNLEIQLQSARLAALKQDSANFDSSIEAARTILEKYFDTEQKSVSAALSSVAELKGVELQPKLPEISTSLKMLRALQSGQSAESVLEELKPEVSEETEQNEIPSSDTEVTEGA